MLGWIVADGRGQADALLASVAGRLERDGWSLAGAVQVNGPEIPGRKCRMDLRVLGTERTVCISQELGPESRGCRLDPSGLETAVGLCEAALDRAPRLLFVNKFGKQEVGGRGFRPLIAAALMRDIPVLTAVPAANVDGFLSFADGLETRLRPQAEAILDWAGQTPVAAASGAMSPGPSPGPSPAARSRAPMSSGA